MTDRELLELAAKASEDYYGEWSDSASAFRMRYSGHWKYWNPLKDDGDAMRLAVKLGIDLVISTSKPARTAAFIPEKFKLDDCMEEPHDNNPYAATRRAIVRAAAEVGKE